MAQQGVIPPDKVAKLRLLFDAIDTDGDGIISRFDFTGGKKDRARHIAFSQMDTEKRDTVAFSDFCGYWAESTYGNFKRRKRLLEAEANVSTLASLAAEFLPTDTDAHAESWWEREKTAEELAAATPDPSAPFANPDTLVDDIIAALDAFALSDHKSLSLSPNLSKEGRTLVFQLCQGRNMTTKSQGEGAQRFAVVRKKAPITEEAALSQMRRTFRRDFQLPPLPVASPLWEGYFDAYPPLRLREKVACLDGALARTGGPAALLAALYDARVRIVRAISATPEFKSLIARTGPLVPPRRTERDPALPPRLWTGVYRPECAGRYYLAVDMRSANFNSLRRLHPGLVLGCPDWPTLARRFSPLEYVVQAKHFRHVVFGHLAPGHQGRTIASLVRDALNAIASDPDLCPNVVAEGTDEIIVGTTLESMRADAERVGEALAGLGEAGGYFRVEAFRLVRRHSVFARETFEDPADLSVYRTELKCVDPAHCYGVAYRAYTGEEVTERDRMYENDKGEMMVLPEGSTYDSVPRRDPC